jgi:hypothetical protein
MIDPLVIPIVAIVGAFVTISIGCVTHYVYLIRRLEREIALKQELVLRGFSAQEIAEVLAATSGGKVAERSCNGHQPQKHAA